MVATDTDNTDTDYIVRVSAKTCERSGAFIMIPNPRLQEGVNILVVDDDQDDIEMIVEALSNDKRVKVVEQAVNGSTAIHLLESKAFRPDIVFLDLNMPQISGFQVLECMREIEGMANTPIVILTTSTRAEDVRNSLRGSAACFIIKPDTYDALCEKTSEIERCVVEGSYMEKQL